MYKVTAISILESQLEQIDKLRKKSVENLEFKQWKENTLVDIERIFGRESREINKFNQISYSSSIGIVSNRSSRYPSYGNTYSAIPQNTYNNSEETYFQKVLDSA